MQTSTNRKLLWVKMFLLLLLFNKTERWHNNSNFGFNSGSPYEMLDLNTLHFETKILKKLRKCLLNLNWISTYLNTENISKFIDLLDVEVNINFADLTRANSIKKKCDCLNPLTCLRPLFPISSYLKIGWHQLKQSCKALT